MQVPLTITRNAGQSRPRVLLVDDHPQVLKSVSGLLSTDFDVVGTATHGLQAVDLALRLHPDIVVLDVAMPTFDGFQTAQALRQQGSPARVVFLTMHRTAEFVSAAMSAGAHGYVLKSRIYSDLVSAIDHAFDGRRFVPFLTSFATLVGGQHAVQFHMNDRFFLDEVSRFVGSTLRSGEPVVVVAGEATRDGLAQRLQAREVDLGRLASRGQFVTHDSAKAVSRVMHGGHPDRDFLTEMVDDLERTRVASVSEPDGRLTIVGDMNVSLCQDGGIEAAIEVERIWDDLTSALPFFTVCTYPVDCFERVGTESFGRICAAHSAVAHTPDIL
ncbi:MAG TPA: response regulator [Vicinamibacterales bacterium]|nr:response regulator [Vicinamibacterales bacterium]